MRTKLGDGDGGKGGETQSTAAMEDDQQLQKDGQQTNVHIANAQEGTAAGGGTGGVAGAGHGSILDRRFTDVLARHDFGPGLYPRGYSNPMTNGPLPTPTFSLDYPGMAPFFNFGAGAPSGGNGPLRLSPSATLSTQPPPLGEQQQMQQQMAMINALQTALTNPGSAGGGDTNAGSGDLSHKMNETEMKKWLQQMWPSAQVFPHSGGGDPAKKSVRGSGGLALPPPVPPPAPPAAPPAPAPSPPPPPPPPPPANDGQASVDRTLSLPSSWDAQTAADLQKQLHSAQRLNVSPKALVGCVEQFLLASQLEDAGNGGASTGNDDGGAERAVKIGRKNSSIFRQYAQHQQNHLQVPHRHEHEHEHDENCGHMRAAATLLKKPLREVSVPLTHPAMPAKGFVLDHYARKRKAPYLSEPSSVDAASLCNCSGTTKCLKLYCVCFQKSQYCRPECGCKCCHNTAENSSLVLKAREKILLRKPRAFDKKVMTIHLPRRLRFTMHCMSTHTHIRAYTCVIIMEKLCEDLV